MAFNALTNCSNNALCNEICSSVLRGSEHCMVLSILISLYNLDNLEGLHYGY